MKLRNATLRRALVIAAAAVAISGPISFSATAQAATTTTAVKYTPTDDAYTSSARPNLNTGTYDKVVAGRLGGDSMVTYLKFKVGNLPAGKVTKAQVTLTRDEHHLPATVKLAKVAATGWSQSSLTYSNRPAPGTVLSTVNTTSTTTAVTFDVSSVVTGAGTYAFAVTSPATDDVARFRSAEYSTDLPKLTVTVTPSTVSSPSPAPSSPAPSPTTTQPDADPARAVHG